MCSSDLFWCKLYIRVIPLLGEGRVDRIQRLVRSWFVFEAREGAIGRDGWINVRVPLTVVIRVRKCFTSKLDREGGSTSASQHDAASRHGEGQNRRGATLED